jgi:hypothetical protein
MTTFVQEAESSWSGLPASITTPAFDALLGDTIVAICIVSLRHATPTISNSGTALTWTSRAVVPTTGDGLEAGIAIWTTLLTEDRPSQTVTFTYNFGENYGGTALTIRDTDGVGTATTRATVSNTPSMSFTTAADNSMVIVAISDNSATSGAARAWITAFGALTELSYFTNGSTYTLYIGYYADTGAIATRTVGLSAPTTGTTPVIAAVEMLTHVEPPLPEQTELIKLTNAR